MSTEERKPATASTAVPANKTIPSSSKCARTFALAPIASRDEGRDTVRSGQHRKRLGIDEITHEARESLHTIVTATNPPMHTQCKVLGRLAHTRTIQNSRMSHLCLHRRVQAFAAVDHA